MALNQNNWEKNERTFTDCQKFIDVFTKANLTDQDEWNSLCVSKSILPCFLSLIRSPTPPYNELFDKDLDSKLCATIKDFWTDPFAYSKN